MDRGLSVWGRGLWIGAYHRGERACDRGLSVGGEGLWIGGYPRGVDRDLSGTDRGIQRPTAEEVRQSSGLASPDRGGHGLSRNAIRK